MSDLADFEVFDSKLSDTVPLSKAATYMDERWLDDWGCIETTLNLIAGAMQQAATLAAKDAEITRLRAEVVRKDRALRAVQESFGSTDYYEGTAKFRALCLVTAALADTADKQPQTGE